MATPEDEYKHLPTPIRVGIWFRLLAFLAAVGGLIAALVIWGWSFYFVPGLLTALALVPTNGETLAQRAIDAVVDVLRERRGPPPSGESAS